MQFELWNYKELNNYFDLRTFDFAQKSWVTISLYWRSIRPDLTRVWSVEWQTRRNNINIGGGAASEASEIGGAAVLPRDKFPDNAL